MTDDTSVELRPDVTVHAHGVGTVHQHPPGDVDQLCINTIRTLAMDAVQQANSGHPGTPMGLAPLAHVLWTRYLKHNPRDPSWPNRDRFVLSAGHASMLLYALLHLTGYDLSLGEIRRFRQWASKTPGHPERGLTPGVEVTTGPLGQGIANAVGLATAERMLGNKFNRPGYPVMDHYTYVIASDGDMMEGVSSEACSLAGNLHLGKLIVFYDDNHITIEGSSELAFCERVVDRFRAYGWHVLKKSPTETTWRRSRGSSMRPAPSRITPLWWSCGRTSATDRPTSRTPRRLTAPLWARRRSEPQSATWAGPTMSPLLCRRRR